jgi:methyl-accepting chemotaxis protein
MSPSSRSERRGRVVVERDFQFRFALQVCLVAGTLFMLFGGVLLLFIKMNYDMLREGALIQMPEMVDGLRREFRFVSLGTVTALIFMTACLFGLGLVLSQRVAGPLFNLKRRLREFSDGKPTVRLRLRSNDEFRNLEEIFNSAMESHERRRDDLRGELTRALEEIRRLEPEPACRRLEQLLETMK